MNQIGGVFMVVVLVTGLFLGPAASLPEEAVVDMDETLVGFGEAVVGDTPDGRTTGDPQPTPPPGTVDVPAAAQVERTTARADARRAGDPDDVPGSDVIRGHLAFWPLPEEPGVVAVRARFQLPSNVTGFGIRVPETARVEGTRGFEREGERLVWTDDESVESPRVTFTLAVNRSSRFGGRDFVDTGRWALVRAPELQPRWRFRGPSLSYRQTLTVAAGDGFAGRNVVYLGEYDVARSGDVAVVMPAAASPRVPAGEVARSLATTGTLLDVGAAGRTTTFVAPGAIRTGGQQIASGDGPEDLRVFQGSKLRHPDSTYRHEYLHTRQSFAVTPGMDWFVEASAEYVTALLGLYQGHYGFDRFRGFVASEDHADAVLVDGSADWARKDYAKGKRVLAALDAKIRRLTDHQHTILDVWRRMNTRDDTIDYEEFKVVVADVAGRPLDDWLDRYVAGTAAPPVPSDPAAFAPADDDVGDVDGDGLPVTAELELGTNPYAADTDGDGLDDGREVELGTDPTDPESDGDGTPGGTDPSPAGTQTEGARETASASDSTDTPTPGFGPGFALVTVLIVALSGRR